MGHSIDGHLRMSLKRYIIIIEQAQKSFEQFIQYKIQSDDSQKSQITIEQ